MGTQQSSAAPSGAAATTVAAKQSNYLQEMWIELKKTTWPTREEAIRLTMLVLVVIVTLGIYMGALDVILSFIITKSGFLK